MGQLAYMGIDEMKELRVEENPHEYVPEQQMETSQNITKNNCHYMNETVTLTEALTLVLTKATARIVH